MKEKSNITKWIYWFIFAVAVIAVYKMLDNFVAIGEFFKNLLGILMPFIMGALVAYILYIPCRKIEVWISNSKRKFFKKRARGLSIFIVYLIVLLLIVILINCILPPVMSSVKDLVGNLPGYYNTLTKAINELPEDSTLVKLNVKEILTNISSINFEKYLTLEYITQYIKGAMSFATGIFNIFVTIIISIYTLAERNSIVRFLKKLSSAIFGDEKYTIIAKYFTKTNEVFFNFITGQLIDAILIGIMTSIAMGILNVKYAVLLGFLIGLFNLIPFFGAIIAVIIAIVITICTGGISKAIWLAIVVIILQQLDANIINPKIISDKLKISPILVILSVTFAGAYFGVLGMFLAVPIVAIIKLILEDYIDYKNYIKQVR